MNRISVPLLFFMCLALVSCKKETAEPHTYTSLVYYENVLPTMGGCIDTSGNLITFSIPFLETASFGSNVLIPARIFKVTGINTAVTISDFGNSNFAGFAYTGYEVNGAGGFITNYSKVSLACTENGKLYASCNSNNGNKIYRISNGGVVANYTIDGLTSLTSFGNNLFAITSPLYNNTNDNVIQQPVIYKIDSSGSMSVYFTFPDNIGFNTMGGASCNGQKCYPFDFVVDIEMSSDSSLFIASAFDSKIYKLDKNKNLTVYNQDIFCPVSIDIDKFNRLFVVSAPMYSPNNEMTRPYQIHITAQPNHSTMLYEASLSSEMADMTYFFSQNLNIRGEASYTINVDSFNRIFVEDYYEKKIYLIQ
jgi:hypothetical protein